MTRRISVTALALILLILAGSAGPASPAASGTAVAPATPPASAGDKAPAAKASAGAGTQAKAADYVPGPGTDWIPFDDPKVVDLLRKINSVGPYEIPPLGVKKDENYANTRWTWSPSAARGCSRRTSSSRWSMAAPAAPFPSRSISPR